jgi:hypothetical protein
VAVQRQILTDKSIARLPFAAVKQYKVRDNELSGFFVLIGRRRKSFMAQGEFWREGVRDFTAQVKLGEFGEMTTREHVARLRKRSAQLPEANDLAKPQRSSRVQ